MATVFVLAANLLPLAGVWFWGWDAFLVLMVFWGETVIVAGWTLARIATMPDPHAAPGETSRGRKLANLGKTAFFALHAGMFIAVHLLFLLTLFSGDWARQMDGPLAFIDALFIKSGAWVALVFAFIAGLIGFVTAIPQPTVVTALSLRLGLRVPAASGKDELGPILGALYTRIMVMQFGIILGGWLAQHFGNRAPLVIVIVLKTLIEMRGGLPFKATMNGKTLSDDTQASR